MIYQLQSEFVNICRTRELANLRKRTAYCTHDPCCDDHTIYIDPFSFSLLSS